MDAEELTKNLIKNINDEDLASAKTNFEKLIANKLYDRLEDRKEDLGKKIYSKDSNSNPESDSDSGHETQTTQEPSGHEQETTSAEYATAEQ